MKNPAALTLAAVMTCLIVLTASSFVLCEPSVGVQKGDWMEYSINMTEGAHLDLMRNLTWYRAEILEVDGTSLLVNKTSRSVNGTYESSIWSFNLEEGELQGWAIIPANLTAGDSFFDAAKSANITIEGEEQKTVLGATRIVTHASDPGKLYREWDKTTGIYVYAKQYTSNYTVTMTAAATNMWTPQPAQSQTTIYQFAAATILLLALVLLCAGVLRRKYQRKPKAVTVNKTWMRRANDT